MANLIECKDINNNYTLIDVRSPGEFKESHIPGAQNIPLFSDEEREIVGTAYKQESVKKAKNLGIQFVAKKLSQIYEKVGELYEENEDIVIYCARGGMRSSSICLLLNSLGYKVMQLKGGYKEYRNYVLEQINEMNKEINYVILHGNTGVGKTLILNRLEELYDLDVLDLEGAANHRGSYLGKVGLNGEVSQKQFESIIFDRLKNRKSNTIFVEAESRRIGTVFIPEIIKEKMGNGTKIFIEGSINERSKRIVEEYTKEKNAKAEIIESITKLRKSMGNDFVDELILLVEKEEYDEVAKKLMIDYYDKLYKKSQEKHTYEYIFNSDDVDFACNQIKFHFAN